MTADARRRKLRFRANHRGFKEVDLVLGAFADAHLDGFDADELDAFEALLAANDRDLWDWIAGRAEPPADQPRAMLERVRGFRHDARDHFTL